MRIATLATGSRGDVQPYIALGVGLQEAGHAVRLVTHRDYESLVRSHVLEFWPVAGNVQDVATYRFPAELDSEQAIFGSFLGQFYRQNRFIPDEVLVPVEPEDAPLLAEWLSEVKGRKVRVARPRRGAKARLV